jgi:hypothetical protein
VHLVYSKKIHDIHHSICVDFHIEAFQNGTIIKVVCSN